MKVIRAMVAILLLTLVLVQGPVAHAKFGNFLKDIKKALGVGQLSDEKIIKGLKEALQVGTGNVVGLISRLDGYYKNPKIKIFLPPEIQKAESVLRKVGLARQVDQFEQSMNRAAEQAAPKAKVLFLDAIQKMSFQEARKILNGGDNEATLYFKDKTADRLGRAFKPIIHSAMAQVGVTRSYQGIQSRLRQLPLTRGLQLDLDQYVTDGALKGLFALLEEEERKIRKDPAARVTDLLKEVFGGDS